MQLNKVSALLSIGCLTSVLLSQPTFAEALLPGGCQMGKCFERKFISKKLLESTSNGSSLYEIEIATRSWKVGTQANSNFKKVKTSYVYCSTSKPAYIFKGVSDIYHAHLLNPGGEWFAYNQSDYPIYWFTCHNLQVPNYFSEDMKTKALQLGYSLNLNSKQVDLKSVREIFK